MKEKLYTATEIVVILCILIQCLFADGNLENTESGVEAEL